MSTISIEKAKYLESYKIELHFSDGKSRVVDFGPFLNTSQHPEIKKYLDLNLFQGFKIVDGDLDWNDFDLTFPIWDLYSGDIQKSSQSPEKEVG